MLHDIRNTMVVSNSVQTAPTAVDKKVVVGGVGGEKEKGKRNGGGPSHVMSIFCPYWHIVCW